MAMQSSSWTDFTKCAICIRSFGPKEMLPVSITCGHVICLKCLKKQPKMICPLDKVPFKSSINQMPVNSSIAKLLNISEGVYESPASNGVSPSEEEDFITLRRHTENIAQILAPVAEKGLQGLPVTCLNRQMIKKLVFLISIPLTEADGRIKLLKAAKSLGERTTTELLQVYQNKQEVSTQLWMALKQRNCQFLGPDMQKETLQNILKVLGTGQFLSRRNIVMFVVQQLHGNHFNSASKTNVGHVVQLLFRATCFNVDKKGDSTFLQLKQEYQTYEALRRSHDTEIVKIAIETGLRIGPDQFSSLLYQDSAHKPHMQSIVDKLTSTGQVPSGLAELQLLIDRSRDSIPGPNLFQDLEMLINLKVDQKDEMSYSYRCCSTVLQSLLNTLKMYTDIVKKKLLREYDGDVTIEKIIGSKFKTGMCRDMQLKGVCPRGEQCTYAHSSAELQRYRFMAGQKQRGKQKAVSPLRSQSADRTLTPDMNPLTLSSVKLPNYTVNSHGGAYAEGVFQNENKFGEANISGSKMLTDDGHTKYLHYLTEDTHQIGHISKHNVCIASRGCSSQASLRTGGSCSSVGFATDVQGVSDDSPSETDNRGKIVKKPSVDGTYSSSCISQQNIKPVQHQILCEGATHFIPKQQYHVEKSCTADSTLVQNEMLLQEKAEALHIKERRLELLEQNLQQMLATGLSNTAVPTSANGTIGNSVGLYSHTAITDQVPKTHVNVTPLHLHLQGHISGVHSYAQRPVGHLFLGASGTAHVEPVYQQSVLAISSGNAVVQVDPRLPQLQPKQMFVHSEDSFPVIVDPSYYSTYP